MSVSQEDILGCTRGWVHISKFVEATNRYSVELRALLALVLYRNRQTQGTHPIVLLHMASQFQLACLQLRHRVEELFEFMKGAFGAVRTTHRAAHALPIHLLCCLLAYSLYKSLIA